MLLPAKKSTNDGAMRVTAAGFIAVIHRPET
jgi:hypothetical protein